MSRRSISEMQTGSLQEEQIRTRSSGDHGMVDQNDLGRSIRGARGFGLELER